MAKVKGSNRGEWATLVSQQFMNHELTPLSDRLKIMLLTLEGFARQKPVCWVGNDVLMAQTGKSETAVQNILVELEKLNFIRRVVESGEGKRTRREGFLLLRRVHPSYPPGNSLTVSEMIAIIETGRSARGRKSKHGLPEKPGPQPSETAIGSTQKSGRIAPGNLGPEHPENKVPSTPKSGYRINTNGIKPNESKTNESSSSSTTSREDDDEKKFAIGSEEDRRRGEITQSPTSSPVADQAIAEITDWVRAHRKKIAEAFPNDRREAVHAARQAFPKSDLAETLEADAERVGKRLGNRWDCVTAALFLASQRRISPTGLMGWILKVAADYAGSEISTEALKARERFINASKQSLVHKLDFCPPEFTTADELKPLTAEELISYAEHWGCPIELGKDGKIIFTNGYDDSKSNLRNAMIGKRDEIVAILQSKVERNRVERERQSAIANDAMFVPISGGDAYTPKSFAELDRIERERQAEIGRQKLRRVVENFKAKRSGRSES